MEFDSTLAPPSLEEHLIALDPQPLSVPAGTNYESAFLNMFLTFLAFAVLLGLTIWFLRKLMRYRLERSSGMQTIRILEKKMLSPKTMLYRVEMDGQTILLAESQLEVKQLKPLMKDQDTQSS